MLQARFEDDPQTRRNVCEECETPQEQPVHARAVVGDDQHALRVACCDVITSDVQSRAVPESHDPRQEVAPQPPDYAQAVTVREG